MISGTGALVSGYCNRNSVGAGRGWGWAKSTAPGGISRLRDAEVTKAILPLGTNGGQRRAGPRPSTAAQGTRWSSERTTVDSVQGASLNWPQARGRRRSA